MLRLATRRGVRGAPPIAAASVARWLVLALAGCSSASAAPGDPPARPPLPVRWVAQPAIANAAAAAAPGAIVDAAGDPAGGCYALWLRLPGSAGDAAALADQVIGGLTGLARTEIVRPAAPAGELSFAFARPPYRGQLRARLAHGQIAATACFGNQREPVACNAACARMLQELP